MRKRVMKQNRLKSSPLLMTGNDPSPNKPFVKRAGGFLLRHKTKFMFMLALLTLIFLRKVGTILKISLR